MILVLFGLLLFVNVLSAQVESPTLAAVPYVRTNVFATSCLLVNGSGMSYTGTSVTQPRTIPWRIRPDPAAPWFAADHQRQNSVLRSGTGRVIVEVIAGVMAVAVPVQRFINAYSSYDTGASPDSRPAVHIQPNIGRGSAWMSAQLRL